MKSLNNGFIADEFPTRELKEMQMQIARVLKEREEEHEKLKRQYQEKLDDLFNTIESDGFYVGIPDWPSKRFVVLEEDDD